MTEMRKAEVEQKEGGFALRQKAEGLAAQSPQQPGPEPELF